MLFGSNLLSSPEIHHFRDDGVDDTPVLLEQSDISAGNPLRQLAKQGANFLQPQEQEAIKRNRAAADARAKEPEQRRRPIRPSSGTPRNSERTKKASIQKAIESSVGRNCICFRLGVISKIYSSLE